MAWEQKVGWALAAWLVAAPFALASSSAPPPVAVDDEDDDEDEGWDDGKKKKKNAKMTYCAYFGPDGNTRHSHCSKKPLAEAQADCDKMLKQKKIEGSCECSDDPDFIGRRCG